MNFDKAMEHMQLGYNIALPEWIGYWSCERDRIIANCWNGEKIDITNINNSNILDIYLKRKDWIVFK